MNLYIWNETRNPLLRTQPWHRCDTTFETPGTLSIWWVWVSVIRVISVISVLRVAQMWYDIWDTWDTLNLMIGWVSVIRVISVVGVLSVAQMTHRCSASLGGLTWRDTGLEMERCRFYREYRYRDRCRQIWVELFFSPSLSPSVFS